MTHHKVPSTSNTIPFKRGAVDVPLEPRGANFRGRRYLQALADMMERAAFILDMNTEREVEEVELAGWSRGIYKSIA